MYLLDSWDVRGFVSLWKVTVFSLYFSLQESRPFSVDFFRKIIQFEKEQVSVLSVCSLSGQMN